MTKITYIVLGIFFLTIAFIVGTPFEFLNTAVDTIATLFLMTLIVVLFVFLFRLARQIEKKYLKRIAVGLLTLIAVPYFLVGLYTIMLSGGNYHPMWQDISIYTNKNGEKVISQWRETSGSIYDYRDRKVMKSS